MFILHDDKGNIIGNVNGPGKGYEKSLAEFNHNWVFLEGELEGFTVQTHYVDINTKEEIEKNFVQDDDHYFAPYMQCVLPKEVFKPTINKTMMKANGEDEVIISDIPQGSLMRITSGQVVYFDGAVTDGSIKLTAEEPTIYEIAILAPVKYYMVTTEVTAQ
jgi:hypothetical protein